MKRNIVLMVMGCILMINSLIVRADIPYITYTYSYNEEPKESPHAYIPHKLYDKNLDRAYELFNPSDLYVDNNQNIYVADTGNNRVVVYDSNFIYLSEIGEFINPQTGEVDALKSPEGVFVTDEGEIYVADTENLRIVEFNQALECVRAIEQPDASILPEGFVYKPKSVVVDGAKRIYVVAKSTNLGIIELNANGEFQNFLGANKVSAQVSDILWKRIMTEEQKKRTQKIVPTEYNNIDIDSRGFIYVTSQNINYDALYQSIKTKVPTEAGTPIKKLNPTGVDVLKRNGFFPQVGEVAIQVRSSEKGPSLINDVAIGEYGIYSLLDNKRNKIFTYSEEGDLLYVFGGTGNEFGMLKNAVAIDYKGDEILVLDKQLNGIVSYKRTEYGDLIYKAIQLGKERKYDESQKKWGEIIKYNSNYEIAYTGIGKVLYGEGRYKEAMECFKTAGDTKNYSKAFKEYRSEVVKKIFLWIPAMLIIIALAIKMLLDYAKKVNIDANLNPAKRGFKQSFMFVFYFIFHPFDGAWELKRQKRGSIQVANLLLVTFLIASIFKSLGMGYMFNPLQGENYSLYKEIVGVVLPILLGCIANWGLTTLMDGKGTFKDIYILTLYGLFPVIVLSFVSTALSNFIALDEAGFLTLIQNLSYAWSCWIIFFGILTIHEYTLPKNIITTALTFVGMGVQVFFCLLFINLVQRIISFGTDVFLELIYRL